MADPVMEVPEYNEVIDLHPNQNGYAGTVRLSAGEVELRERAETAMPELTEEERVRNRKRFLRRVQKRMKSRLSSAEVTTVLETYSRRKSCPPPRDLGQLFLDMEEKGELEDLLELQTSLCQAGFNGVSNELADLAKSARLCNEVAVTHFSQVEVEDDDIGGEDQCQIVVFLGGEDLGVLGRRVSALPGCLSSLFGWSPEKFSTFKVVPANSVWVRLLAPSGAGEALRQALSRQDLHNALASWGIAKVRLLRGQGRAECSPSTTPVKQEPEEPAEKKIKVELPEKATSPNPGTTSKAYFGGNALEHQWVEWEKIDVVRYFNERGMPQVVIALHKLEFTGSEVAFWSLSLLREKGLKEDVAKAVMEELQTLAKYRSPVTTKLIHDCIHGPMEFHPMCVRIMDTPEFQRLRYIKQLGSVYLVFPSAGHSRFEHSLGTCYLAHQLVTSIQDRQPEMNITDIDVLCVSIAGLCLDLGHGPYSRLFEQFMHAVLGEADWHHQETSYMLFDYLIEKNELRTELFRYGMTEGDIQFIREQILGRQGDRKKYRGRGKEKSFLYEMVAWRQNGIDVKKWDYIARDSLMLGVSNSFDYRRFVMHARVIETPSGLRICARDKDADDHYKMFQSRYSLCRRAYYHKVNQSVEAMLLDVLLCVERSDSITYTTEIRKQIRLSGCAYDPVAFTRLTDSVFDLVELSKSKDLQEAREIMENIRLRRFYSMMAETEPTHVDISLESLPSSIAKSSRVVVKKLYLDYGLKERDPIEQMLFYRKSDPYTAVKVSKAQVSVILPEKFSECILRLFCKDKEDASIWSDIRRFETWCDNSALRLRTYMKLH